MATARPTVGRMRHRVAILRQQPRVDPLGQAVEEWVPITGGDQIPAEIRETGGTETVRGGIQVASQRKTIVRIRYRNGIKETDRLRTADGRLLEITAVLDKSGMRRYLDLETNDLAGEPAPDG